MEDALVLSLFLCLALSLSVLILVLMEDALVRKEVKHEGHVNNSLNPCFNGRCTSTTTKGLISDKDLLS